MLKIPKVAVNSSGCVLSHSSERTYPPRSPTISSAETIGRLNQKFFGRRVETMVCVPMNLSPKCGHQRNLLLGCSPNEIDHI
jgi:hypothetical protein